MNTLKNLVIQKLITILFEIIFYKTMSAFRKLSKAPINSYRTLHFHIIALDELRLTQNKFECIKLLKQIFTDIIRYNYPAAIDNKIILRLIEHKHRKVHVNLSADDSRFYFARTRHNIYNVLKGPQINLDNIMPNFDESYNSSEYMVVFRNVRTGGASLCVLKIDSPKSNDQSELNQFTDKDVLKQSEHDKNPITIQFDAFFKRAVNSHTFSIKIYHDIFNFTKSPMMTIPDQNPPSKLKITQELITKTSITKSCDEYEKNLIASRNQLCATEKRVNDLNEQLDFYKIYVNNLQKQLDDTKNKMLEAK